MGGAVSCVSPLLLSCHICHLLPSLLTQAGTEKSDPEAFAHSWETVRAATGVLVPGGFGDRGVEGKIAAVKVRLARVEGMVVVVAVGKHYVTPPFSHPHSSTRVRRRCPSLASASASSAR